MRILFQGDSITDAGRTRDGEPDVAMGSGYPLLIKAELGMDNPGQMEFINRGISGNRIVDVYARIKRDIINLKPDVMSILIGVNDVWHELHESPNGVDAEKFYKVYAMLIEELQAALPEMKIMIMEPFVLEASATTEHWLEFSTEVPLRAKMAKKIAEDFALPFVPLQEGFDQLAQSAPNDYWLRDGVHPSTMGHEFIKREWIKAFKKL